MTVTTVDVHAHAILGAVEALVADEPGLADQRALDLLRNGAESMAASGSMVRDRMPQLTSVERRLLDMDAQGVDVQVVSPSPSQYHYYAGADRAAEVCRTANREIAGLVAQAPDRLRGLGLVPLQHPSQCVDALDDAIVACGLQGVEISSFAPRGEGTVELSDPELDPFWARAEELGAVVFLHPFGCSLDARLDRFYLANIVGQPVENAVALSHLVFAGVLDRFPRLRILAAHGGGYLPTYLGRADHGWRVRPESRTCREVPSAYLRRIFYDSLVHSPEQLRMLIASVGADRVLLGSDYPFDMGSTDPVAAVRQAGLVPTDVDLLLGRNATALGLLDSLPAPATQGARP